LLQRLPNLKQRLDETQQIAVTHGEGPLLITAGPGSGKTTVITHHIKHLIDHQGVSPKEILVITFTKSAATEMKERFLRLMNQRNTEVDFGTFHAFFYQILRQSGGFGHNSILKDKEKLVILRDILKAKKLHFYDNTFLEDLLGEISQAKNKNNIMEYESSSVEKEMFQDIYREYQRRKSSLHKIDFDDMVIHCHELLQKDENVLRKWQERFRYILIDEFQDINHLQYEIVKMLAAKHHNIFAVGDEDQSIYSFRGANPKICFEFLKDFPDAEHIFLTTNYRCDKEIVEASKRLISNNKERFEKEIRAAKDSNTDDNHTEENSVIRKNINAVEIKQFRYEQESYEEMAQTLKKYEKGGKLSDCVVLFRTNMISPLFIQELKKHRIPYRMKSNCKDWKENPVVKDILAYLDLARGNLHRKNFYRIMNKPVRYISRDMISEEVMTWQVLEENAKGHLSVLEQIRKLRQDLDYIRRLPVFAALGYIRRGIGYEKWLREQGGRVSQEGIEILETLRIMSRDCETAEELQEMVDAVAVRDTVETTEEALQIMTYHGAKGLEWPVVFLPDVVEGIVPYKRAHSKEETEEERRMFYVALTRAKEQAYVYSLFEDEKHKKSPSVFLKELKGE